MPEVVEPIIEKLREPYNSKYCKAVDCKYRQGNKCSIDECVHNFKCILYWERTGNLHPKDESDRKKP